MPAEPAYGEPRFAEPPLLEASRAQAQTRTDGIPLYGRPELVPRYASWSRRVGAAVIDGFLVGLSTFVPTEVGVVVGGAAGQVLVLLGNVAGIAVFVANSIVRQGRTGRSIGKAEAGIRLVRSLDGHPLGAGAAFARQLAHVLDLPFLLGFLWPLWDSKRQTFADKAAGAVVLREDR